MKQIINKEGDVIGVDDAYVLKEGEVWAEEVEDDTSKEGEVSEEKSEEEQVAEETHPAKDEEEE